MGAAFKPETATLGVSLVALGLLWTLANTGQLQMLSTLRTWWPLTLVLWGTLELVNTYLARRRS